MKKEDQVTKFEEVDNSFDELRNLLDFRDKDKEKDDKYERKRQIRQGKVDADSDDEWDKELRGYLFDKKAKATDRTKTPEEIAKESHEKLEELERKRLNRMNYEFEGDDLSDVEIGAGGGGGGGGRRAR